MSISGIVPSDVVRTPMQSSRIQRDALESGGEELVWRMDVTATAYQRRSMSVGVIEGCRGVGWCGSRVPVVELKCLKIRQETGPNLNSMCEKGDSPKYRRRC